MNYKIDTNVKKPAYLQLYEQIKADIIKEIYPYGAKLPSKRTVCAELNISTVTVEHAYALLCDEGYIEARQRRGYIVIFHSGDAYGTTSTEPIIPHLTHTSPVILEFPICVRIWKILWNWKVRRLFFLIFVMVLLVPFWQNV